MNLIAILVAFVAACGTNNSHDMPDGNTVGGDDALPPNDAAPIAGYTQVPLTCMDYTRTVTHNNGDHDITIESWAFANLAPGADFIVIQCQPAPTDPACQSPDVCTGTQIPPGAQQCFGVKDGDFRDGKLAIHCGTKTKTVLASGTVQSMTSTSYTVVLEAK